MFITNKNMDNLRYDEKRHPLYNKVYLYFLEKAYKSKTKIKANKCLQALFKEKLSKYDRDDF